MNLKTVLRCAITAAIFAKVPSTFAAATAEATFYDNRIQNVLYNPDDVAVVKVFTGVSTLIQFEKGEAVEGEPSGLSIGDKAAWTVGVRGNNIFVKPAGEFPDTNINVVTNKRTYSIDLVSAKEKKSASYIVRYNYPAPVIPYKAPVVDKGPCSDGRKNLNYFMWGDRDLAPTAAWDDGQFTCFRFPNSAALPIIYRTTKTGTNPEAIVNFSMKDDVVIVHEVAPEFRLRLGDAVLGIKTDSLVYAPYSNKNTSVPNVKRVLKNDD